MKRFHVHIAVDDLEVNVRFYSAVFGMQPTVLKEDYAKWMVQDPHVNFAISKRGIKTGIDHLGIQVDSAPELVALRDQVASALNPGFAQKEATCCYARSDKYWTSDPQGIAWEVFHTVDTLPMYGDAEPPQKSACCSPAAKQSTEGAEPNTCC
jgi:catechol 2,3-dioxygenase-like lactoylglutathione lyase family enzyme